MNFYTWFSTHFLSQPAQHRNSVIVHPSNIIFAPKPRIYYQNICILPRKIPLNIQITYFYTWNSPTFCHFQLSAILFAFLQTNFDHSFGKYRLSIIFSLINIV